MGNVMENGNKKEKVITRMPNDAFNRNIESDGSDTCELCINESVWNIHDCFIALR